MDLLLLEVKERSSFNFFLFLPLSSTLFGSWFLDLGICFIYLLFS